MEAMAIIALASFSADEAKSINRGKNHYNPFYTFWVIWIFNKEFKMSLRWRQRKRQRERLKKSEWVKTDKTTVLHVQYSFLVHFFAVTARLRLELPNFMFYNNNNNNNNYYYYYYYYYYLYCAFSIKYSKARPRPRVALRRISVSLFKLGYIS